MLVVSRRRDGTGQSPVRLTEPISVLRCTSSRAGTGTAACGRTTAAPGRSASGGSSSAKVFAPYTIPSRSSSSESVMRPSLIARLSCCAAASRSASDTRSLA